MAGLIPGVILTLMIMAVIYVWATVRPEHAPRSTETYPWKERLAGLKTPVPILAIFAFMIAGIYNGLFSPAEAAGMGVLFTIIMMVVMGKFTWRKFFDALTESVKFFTFMFVALMAAIMFASTIALSQLPQFIADWALGTVESPLAILYMVILIFVFAGFFLENFGMIMMLVPLFFPVVVQAGYDPVYFGVIMVMMMEVGLLTPPAAPNIYVTQYVDGEASVMEVINGSLPFYFTVLGLTVLLVHFPMIAMWLPGTMR